MENAIKDRRIREALKEADSFGKLGVVAEVSGIAGGVNLLREIMNSEDNLSIIDRVVLETYLLD